MEFSVTTPAAATSKTRELWLPDILKPAGRAEASMMRSSEIVSWPLVRTLVSPDSAASNLMASAPTLVLAKVMASRSEPGPLSARLVTTRVAAEEWSAVPSNHASARRHGGNDRVFILFDFIIGSEDSCRVGQGCPWK